MSVKSSSSGARWALLLLISWAPWAMAQDAETATRAQRDAANPLRMIIEAGKLKVRQKSPEAEPEPAAKPAAPARVAAPKPPQVASPALVAAPSQPTARPASTPVAAATAEPPPPVAAPAAPTDAEPTPATPAAVEALSTAAAPAAEASDATPAAQEPQLALAAPSLPATPLPATAPRRTALELVDYVEPVLNERLRRRLKGDGEVVVEFTIRADGSVADPAVRSASDKVLEEAALEAVRQWRYQPIPAAQPHAVQLVFKFRE